MLIQNLRSTTRNCNLFSGSVASRIARRTMSAHGTTLHEMAAYLKPVEDRIAKYRLDLETNPAVLDQLAEEGKISTHTANFFKAEILKREKGIRKLKLIFRAK